MGNEAKLWKIPPRVLAKIHEKDTSNLSVWNIYFHPNPLLRWIFWERLRIVMNNCQNLICESVLDIGCGGGELLLSLSKNFPRVMGLDINISNAQKLVSYYGLKNVDLYEGDFFDLSLGGTYFDLVIVCDVLEHQLSLSPFIKKVASVLNPGGRVLVSIPNENVLYRLGRLLLRIDPPKDHYNQTKVIFQELKTQFIVEKIVNIPSRILSVFKLIKCRKN